MDDNVQIEKMEKIEELLAQLQRNFVSTYKEIHIIMEEMKEDADMDENPKSGDGAGADMDDELDYELVSHMEEIFGEDE